MGSAEPQENEAERTADESSRVEEERIKQILARENRRQQRNLSRTVRTTGEPVVTVELLTDTPPIPAQLARPDAEPMEEISEDEGVQNQTTRRMEQQRGDVATHDQSRLELGEVGMSNLKCVEPWIIHRAGKDPLYTPLRTALIAIHHDNITAGHFGQAKTYELISRSYTWKGLREEVEQYVARCHGCLRFYRRIGTCRKDEERRDHVLLRSLPPTRGTQGNHFRSRPPVSSCAVEGNA
eukprot:GHVS01066554.1.p1 GENE.GHVS01066554.1~~GHVS01066554.1.p1  ORF type:complete len:239 (-),score=8.36 GHVS01066554.1:686-1402(-)